MIKIAHYTQMESRRKVILVRHDLFNPITYADLRLMELAKEYLVSLDRFEVLEGIMSVDNGFEKGPGYLAANYRVTMVETAITMLDWVTVDQWASLHDNTIFVTITAVLQHFEKMFHGNLPIRTHQFRHLDDKRKTPIAPYVKGLSSQAMRRPSFGISEEAYYEIYSEPGRAYLGTDAINIAKRHALKSTDSTYSAYKPSEEEKIPSPPPKPARPRQDSRIFGSTSSSESSFNVSSDISFTDVPQTPAPYSAFAPDTPHKGQDQFAFPTPEKQQYPPDTPALQTSFEQGFDPRFPHIPPGTVIRPKRKQSAKILDDASDIFTNYGKKIHTPEQLAVTKAKKRGEIDVIMILTLQNLKDLVPRAAQSSSEREVRELFESGVIVVCNEDDDPYLIIDSCDVIKEYLHNIHVVQDPIKCVIPQEHVRTLVHRGESIRYLVPDAVADYIAQMGVYA